MTLNLTNKTTKLQSLINKNFKYRKEVKLIENILNKYDVLDEIKALPNEILEMPVYFENKESSLPIATALGAAIYTKRINIIEAILDKNINLNASPLDFIHLLTKPDYFSVECVKRFLNQGFDVNHTFILPAELMPINIFNENKREVGFLDFAIKSCVSTMLFDNEDIQPFAFEIVKIFVEYQAPMPDGGANILASTIAHHSEKLLIKLLEHPNFTTLAYEKTKEFADKLTLRYSHSGSHEIIPNRYYELIDKYFEKQHLESVLTTFSNANNKNKKQKI
jgi:hypothetical protein